MAFEDTLRNTVNTLAMTFNPEVGMGLLKQQEQRKAEAIKSLTDAVQTGSMPPEQAYQIAQQKGLPLPQGLGMDIQAQAQQETLKQKQAMDAMNARIRPALQAISEDKTLTPEQKQQRAYSLYAEIDPRSALKAGAVPPQQLQQTTEGIQSVGKSPFGVTTQDTGLKPPVKVSGGFWANLPPATQATVKMLAERSEAGDETWKTRENPRTVALVDNYLSSKGTHGTEISGKKIEYKADSSGLVALTKDLTAIEPFKVMLDTNVGIAKDLAKKVMKTDSTLANKPIAWIQQNVTGNPDVAEYMAQIQIVQTEAARVLNNPRLVGQLTDSARHEMQNIVQGTMPLESTIRVLDRIKKDGDNRVNAMYAQSDAMKKKLGVKESPKTGGVKFLGFE